MKKIKTFIKMLNNWFLEKDSVSNWNDKAYRALKNRCSCLSTLSDKKLLDLKERVEEKTKLLGRLIRSSSFIPISRAQVVGCCFAHVDNTMSQELAYWQGALENIEEEIFVVRKLKIEEP